MVSYPRRLAAGQPGGVGRQAAAIAGTGWHEGQIRAVACLAACRASCSCRGFCCHPVHPAPAAANGLAPSAVSLASLLLPRVSLVDAAPPVACCRPAWSRRRRSTLPALACPRQRGEQQRRAAPRARGRRRAQPRARPPAAPPPAASSSRPRPAKRAHRGRAPAPPSPPPAPPSRRRPGRQQPSPRASPRRRRRQRSRRRSRRRPRRSSSSQPGMARRTPTTTA